MERLKLRYQDARRAAGTLRDILEEPFSVIVRDAAIQRFEYTFEALWKLTKDYLHDLEGIACGSPKACFREAMTVGLLSEEETLRFLQMTDDRNLTSHTYKQEVASSLYGRLKDHCASMEALLQRFKI